MDSREAPRLGLHVYEGVKERLLGGEWPAGQLIQVETLRRDFGTSKQPIMEAMRRLASDGLIEIIPQVGCRVPVYSRTEIEDFFTVFASVEAETVAAATVRRTPDQLRALRAINARMELVSVVDVSERARRYRLINREFHAVILEMAHSSVFSRTSRQMWDMSDLLINGAALDSPIADEVDERHDEHESIIGAVRDSDPDSARSYMRGHILRNIAMLERSASASTP